MAKTTEALQIEQDRKSDPPRGAPSKQELSVSVADPTRKQESAPAPARKDEVVLVSTEVKMDRLVKMAELTPASKKLVTEELAKKSESITVLQVQKTEPSKKPEEVPAAEASRKPEPKIVPLAPKVEPTKKSETITSKLEQPKAKPEAVQPRKPAEKGIIITKMFNRLLLCC